MELKMQRSLGFYGNGCGGDKQRVRWENITRLLRVAQGNGEKGMKSGVREQRMLGLRIFSVCSGLGVVVMVSRRVAIAISDWLDFR